MTYPALTYYTGLSKHLIELKIKVYTLLYFSGLLLSGKVRAKYFLRIIKRLLFFLKNMKHNKYIKTGKRVKINLYLPGFPSKAFFTACKKVIEFKKPFPCITALVSISSACQYDCPHCYQKFDKGKDADINKLTGVIKKLQDMGIAFFNIEGGDPFLTFDRLKTVCYAIDNRSEILINSTGNGITRERLLELKKQDNLFGIMFSLHLTTPDKLNLFMRHKDAWNNLENGIRLCHETSIPVTFNSCLMKEDYFNGTFEKIIELANHYHGCLIQLIKPKPAGGWIDSDISPFTPEDEKEIISKVNHYNQTRKHKNNISIYAMIREESPALFGCTAGGTDRFYINAKGDLQPCEFLNISFGNIQDEEFDVLYNRMREVFKEPSANMLCEQCSKKVHELKKEHGLTSLPLSPELSKQIYSDWDRSKKSQFYEKLYKT